jgi:hypothetical protein
MVTNDFSFWQLNYYYIPLSLNLGVSFKNMETSKTSFKSVKPWGNNNPIQLELNHVGNTPNFKAWEE